jgi:DNA transposition AAA+ family ATPase
MKENKTPFYIESTSYRSFKELCEACRDQEKIGMSFGRPGVGKTEASLRFSEWALVEANLAVRNGVPVEPERLVACDTLYYRPGVTVSPQRLKTELGVLKNKFSDIKVCAISWQSPAVWSVALQTPQVRLIIVDEAHRLKYSSLEELRDLQERWNVGMVLIGDPGMERSLARTYHFADRVRYLEKFEPLVSDDLRKYVDKQAELLAVPKPTDEVFQIIAKYSRGNPRVLGHLFAIVQRLLKINDDIVREITVEVTETAREMMLVGLGVIPKAGDQQLAHVS